MFFKENIFPFNDYFPAQTINCDDGEPLRKFDRDGTLEKEVRRRDKVTIVIIFEVFLYSSRNQKLNSTFLFAVYETKNLYYYKFKKEKVLKYLKKE